MTRLKRAKDHSFYKSLIQLLSGSAIAQLITAIVSIVLTRIYNVEEIAHYSMLLTFVSLFAPVISAKLDTAIVIADNDQEASRLAWGSLYISLIGVIVASFSYNIYMNYNSDGQGILVYTILLVFLLIAHAVVNILISINNRNNEYALLSRLQVQRSVVQNVAFVGFGWLNFSVVGLVLAQFLSLLSGIRLQLRQISFKNLYPIPTRKQIVKVVQKYKNQYLYALPAHFINSASYSILNLFIMSSFGMIIFGYYSMTFRILSLPLALVSMNMSRIFLRRASELNEQGKVFKELLLKVTKILSLVAIPMVTVLLLFAPPLFKLLLGTEWEVAGEYARILAPMYGVRLVVSALTPALMIKKKQSIELMMQSLFLIAAVISYWIVIANKYNVEVYLYIISITYSLIYILLYVLIYKYSTKK